MKKIDFVKVVGSGNDFIIISARDWFTSGGDHRKDQLPVANRQLPEFVRRVCARKNSIGADGVLVLENSKVANVKMRVFNPDGGEVEMCGNGARCVALWAKKSRPENIKNMTIETKAGVLEAEVISKDRVKLKMSEPKDIRLDFSLELNGRDYRVSFINTGVPHTVLSVDDIEEIDVLKLGNNIRYHSHFQPAGTNVNFMEQIDTRNIRIRTYERGVEGETLACGTGAVASAIINVVRMSSFVAPTSSPKKEIRNTHKINVHTKSGEVLRVYFDFQGDKVSNVWLEGKAEIVYRGQMTLPLA